MRIALAADHAGYALKETIRKHLLSYGYEIYDFGTDSAEISVDYPVYSEKAAKAVSSGECAFGVLCCGTGEGIMMAANKVKGVRCGLGYDLEVSRLIRRHNDANMISFGARFMDERDVLMRLDAFLTTPFEGGRHKKRVDEISALEERE